MHEIMLTICVLGIVMCFYSVYIIVARKNTEKASFMVVVIICSTMNLVGYLLELTSTELSAMMVAVKFQYLGKTFAGTFLLLTFRRYYKWNLPNALMWVFWAIDIVMYIIIFTSDKHKLYYTSFGVKEVDGHIFVDLGKSPLYIAFMAYVLFLTLLFSWWSYKQYKKDTGKEKRVSLTLVIASLASCLMIVLSLTINKTNYDFVPIIMALLTVTIAILIRKFGLFSTMEIAKENLIVNISEGVVVMDTNGRFNYANPAAREMIPELETMKPELLTEYISSIVNNDDGDVYINNRYYQVMSTMLYEKKDVAGKLITFFDVTKLREDAMQMEQLKNEADNANRAKSNFLANMSHEIRTPINAVLGMDEMIIRETEDPVILEYATNIKSAGENLLSLVNDILDLSKIESGKMHLINVDYKTVDVIKSIVNTMSLRMSEKGLSFVVEADKQMPSVLHGDEMRIKQIVMNLLSNACKYTREGHVKLRFAGEKDDASYKLKVYVEDTGIGIKDEDLSRLFDSFERIDETKNRNIEGTGLGLSITNNLLSMMGSRLQVESTYGVGSIFSFEISQTIVDDYPIGDINKVTEVKLGRSSSVKAYMAPDAKILVVDDNAINLAVMKGLLKKTGAHVETALSGMDCLQMIKGTAYNLIFMDHLMPDMDGIETLHKMRNFTLHKNVETPVIVLTANAVAGAREMYLENGFTDYLTKPVDVDALEEMILNNLPDELIHFEQNA